MAPSSVLRPARTLLACASLSLVWVVGELATASEDPPAAETGATETEAAAEVDLAVLREGAIAHLGGRVRTVIQLATYDEPWHAVLGRFGPVDFARIAAWSDTQYPWLELDYADPAPFLFARRDSTADFVLRNARPHERFRVTLEVREHFRGEPWCEITAVERIDLAINEGSVLHASRAIEARDKGTIELAYSELERALSSPLPIHARQALEALRAEWMAADGR